LDIHNFGSTVFLAFERCFSSQQFPPPLSKFSDVRCSPLHRFRNTHRLLPFEVGPQSRMPLYPVGGPRPLAFHTQVLVPRFGVPFLEVSSPSSSFFSGCPQPDSQTPFRSPQRPAVLFRIVSCFRFRRGYPLASSCLGTLSLPLPSVLSVPPSRSGAVAPPKGLNGSDCPMFLLFFLPPPFVARSVGLFFLGAWMFATCRFGPVPQFAFPL